MPSWSVSATSRWRCCVYLAGIAGLLRHGVPIELPAIGGRLGLSPPAAFGLYLTLNALLEGSALLLILHACSTRPFHCACRSWPPRRCSCSRRESSFWARRSLAGMVIGVSLVAGGSLLVYRQLFSQGLLGPAKAIVRHRGSRYMLLAALLFTFTAVLDKWFTVSGSPATLAAQTARSLLLATGKCAALTVFLAILSALRLFRRRACL